MKKIIVLFIFSFLVSIGFSQSKKKITYLVALIYRDYDSKNHRSFTRIDAEGGNQFASEVYGLIHYETGKRGNATANYYGTKTDTTTVFYNFFLNTTEALQFMADHGWELVTVNNSEYLRDIDTRGIQSSAIYYFRKTIE